MIGSRWVNDETFAGMEYDALGANYREAAPFPHLVIDHLFSMPKLRALAEEFENGASPDWRDFRGALQSKRGTASDADLPNTVQEYFNFLYSGPFIRFLSRVTGIDDLIPDPALHGAGMHEVNAGGRFEIHLDFKKHPRTGLSNRLVVITYLNDDWTPEQGGLLELWELAPPSCTTKIVPTFGRTVIMEQSGRSAHGHPQPVGQGRQRRSVIAYFYTAQLAEEARSDRLATTYIPHDGLSWTQQTVLLLRKITPPSLAKNLKAVRKASLEKVSRLL